MRYDASPLHRLHLMHLNKKGSSHIWSLPRAQHIWQLSSIENSSTYIYIEVVRPVYEVLVYFVIYSAFIEIVSSNFRFSAVKEHKETINLLK